MHIRVSDDDVKRLQALSEATGRKQTTIAALAISWFVRHPVLAAAPSAIIGFVQCGLQRQWGPDDFAALLELMGGNRPADVLEMQRRRRDR